MNESFVKLAKKYGLTVGSTWINLELNMLIVKKDEHKANEYKVKLDIKAIEQLIRDEEHKIDPGVLY